MFCTYPVLQIFCFDEGKVRTSFFFFLLYVDGQLHVL